MNAERNGHTSAVILRPLHRHGLRSDHLHTLSFGSIALCIALWIRAKTVDQDERGNAERRALFVGLWAPTLWQIGDSLKTLERPIRRSLRNRLS